MLEWRGPAIDIAMSSPPSSSDPSQPRPPKPIHFSQPRFEELAQLAEQQMDQTREAPVPLESLAATSPAEPDDTFLAAPTPPVAKNFAPPAESTLGAQQRVLIVHQAGSTRRLMQEALENFTDAEIHTAGSALRAFELAMTREFHLFLFSLEMEELNGPLLYEFIEKAYAHSQVGVRIPPGVIFIREPKGPDLSKEFRGDVRIKGILSKPLKIDTLLKQVGMSIPVLDPTAGGS